MKMQETAFLPFSCYGLCMIRLVFISNSRVALLAPRAKKETQKAKCFLQTNCTFSQAIPRGIRGRSKIDVNCWCFTKCPYAFCAYMHTCCASIYTRNAKLAIISGILSFWGHQVQFMIIFLKVGWCWLLCNTWRWVLSMCVNVYDIATEMFQFTSKNSRALKYCKMLFSLYRIHILIISH